LALAIPDAPPYYNHQIEGNDYDVDVRDTHFFVILGAKIAVV
jgi:hypothetical protein